MQKQWGLDWKIRIGEDAGRMADEADEQLRRARRRTVAGLDAAFIRLMSEPAEARAEINEELVSRLREVAVDFRGVESTYTRVADWAFAEDPRSHEKHETYARGQQCKQFAALLEGAAESNMPWMAGITRTVTETVRPEDRDGVRLSKQERAMGSASLEAAVRCMPPDPDKWRAADFVGDEWDGSSIASSGGMRRMAEYNNAVSEWEHLDRWPKDHPASLNGELTVGHGLRGVVGAGFKASIERTDGELGRVREVTAAQEQSRRAVDDELEPGLSEACPGTSDAWALRNGIPAAIDGFPAPNESIQHHPDLKIIMQPQEWSRAMEVIGEERVRVPILPDTARATDHVGFIGAEDHSRLLASVSERLKEDTPSFDAFQALSSAEGSLERARPVLRHEPRLETDNPSRYFSAQPDVPSGLSADLDR